MISPANLYPELDSVEIRETIEPLGVFAPAVHVKLSAPSDVAPEAPSPAALAWSLEPEAYPFQRVIRRLALPAADRLLPEELTEAVADLDAFTLQVLGRAEARLRDVATRTLVAAVNKASTEGLLRGRPRTSATRTSSPGRGETPWSRSRCSTPRPAMWCATPARPRANWSGASTPTGTRSSGSPASTPTTRCCPSAGPTATRTPTAGR